MDKFIVAVFPDEAGAYAGVRRLKELHRARSLTLVRWAVVQKDAKGAVAVKEVGDPEVGNTVFGALLGGLAGVLGGPVGAAMGMSIGAVFGALGDLRDLDVGEDFLEQVSAELTNGRSAVVAEVFETWVAPLDAEIEAAGGVLVRQIRFDFEDEKAAREAEAERRELERLRAEWRQATEEQKARLKASIERTEAKLQASLVKIDRRLDRISEDAERKIQALQDQLAQARDEKRQEIEQQITEAHSDLEVRREKLRQAGELVRNALAPAKAARREPA